MKKGFTIVELLTVIAILAIISLIAVPSYMGISKSIRKDMYCEKVQVILNGSKQWGNENLSQLKSDCYIEKTVGYFVQEGYLKKEQDVSGQYILNPYTNSPMDPLIIRLYLNNKRASAWYVETTDELKNACDDAYISRPNRKC